MYAIIHRLTPVTLTLLTCACNTPTPPPEADVTQAITAVDPGVWVPRSSLTALQAAQAREALEAAGLPVYLVLPGNVLVTAASATPPASTAFEPLSRSTTWSTRATTEQSRSVQLAQSLLQSTGRVTANAGFIDEVFKVEDQLSEARAALEAERASTTNTTVLRRIDADLASLAAETTALTAEPLIGTPAHSRRKYLRGSILVFCLFVESTGTGNENWTTTEVQAELASYAASLLALARVAPPEYHLSFTLAHIAPTDARMRISHEPTSGVDERTWIVQVLRNLGYSGVITAAGGTQRFERDQIAQFGVREGTVVYVARDALAPFASFGDYDTTAWPHAGFNSYAITNSSADGGTLVHELLHTFNAEDEYSDPNRRNYGCVARSKVGHDRAVEAGSGPHSNANQVDCAPLEPHQSCLMRSSSTLLTTPFERPVLCWHTRAQIGWRDTASVRVRLTGLPTTTPEAFTPSLITHVDLHAAPLAETFSYVEEGNIFVGGRRCLVHGGTGTRFTTSGDVVNCPSFSFRAETVVGSPGDIRVSSPANEGRVRELSVPYTPTFEQPCGDGVCDLTENDTSCPAECICGNDVCDGDETVVSCPRDCAFCGDDLCTPGETRANCPADCSPSVPTPEGR